MDKINVYKKDGTKSGEIQLNESIFNVRINKRLLDDVVRLYGNNKRTGNSSTKTFGEVRGGGKRPWKQKGTGRARSSSKNNPLWRGGGIIFGPKPRDINFTIPKKMRQKAILSALSVKNKENDLCLIEDLSLEQPKTKELAAILKTLELSDKSILCVVEDKNENIARASKNVSRLSMKSVDEFNAYHVMKKKKLIFEKKALDKLEKRLQDVL